MDGLLQLTDCGLYCPQGDFHIDPWRGVDRAVITHAHGDHAHAGSAAYLTAQPGVDLLRARLGPAAAIQGAAYGEAIDYRGVRVSLHPAGHILGSSQVRLEYRGEVWVVSGDYKWEPDPTCTAFEPVRCHTFVTESTFGLPIYRWPGEQDVCDAMHAWWRANQQAGRTSILFCYALGKAQRVLARLDASIGPVLVHGAVARLNGYYAAQGVALAPAVHTGAWEGATSRALVIAPPSTQSTPWLRRFGAVSTAFASGWMRIRGARRRRSLDRGFVLSDHADWPGLLRAVEASGAERVWVTHGFRSTLVRWLLEHGYDAREVETRFSGEQEDTAGVAGEEPAA